MPVLEEPVLIEGLPGVGNVGKLAAEHLVEQLKATKFADIYSKYFPPQVLVDDEGLIRLVNNELYYSKGEGDGQTSSSWSVITRDCRRRDSTSFRTTSSRS